MKNFILLLGFFSCLSSPLVGQNYLNSSASWYTLEGDVFDLWFKRSIYFVEGDTLVNDKTYHKIKQRYDYLQLTYDGSDLDTSFYYEGLGYLLLREEGAKFYLKEDEGEADKLLFNFDMNIGDMIGDISPLDYVVNIDTIMINDQPRRVFITDYGDRIYEGIGSSRGLTEGLGYQGEEHFSILKCFSIDEQSYEITPGFIDYDMPMQECGEYLTTPTKEIPRSAHKLHLYPNPFKQTIWLDTDMKTPQSLSIFSVQGQLVYHSDDIQGRSSIDLAHLQPGFYLLELRGEEIIRMKIIKE